MTDIYMAIMRAADHIESFPSEFYFGSVRIPASAHCGTPGCAIGWIDHFAGFQSCSIRGTDYSGPLNSLGLALQGDFYERMDALCTWQTSDLKTRWRSNAESCARGLRLYADKYHKPAVAQTHQLVPYQEQFAVGAWDVFKPKALSI